MSLFGGIVKIGTLGLVDIDKPAEDAADAANRQADATLQQSAQNRALNVERYGEAKGRLQPFSDAETAANKQMMIEMGLAPGSPGTAYMQSPGYQSMMKESLGAAEQSAISSGSTLYGGRRLQAAGQVGAGVQQSYYTNYMNLLQRLSTPNTATNLSSLGVNQAATMGNEAQNAMQAAGNYRMQAANIPMQQNADQMGMIANLGAGALSGGYI